MTATRTRDIAQEATRMMRDGDWSDASAAHYVAAYSIAYERTYGVRPLLPAGDRHRAEKLAAAVLDGSFAGDAAAMAVYLRWTWQQEKKREQWRRDNGRVTQPLGWRPMFGPELLNAYRIAARKAGVNVDAESDSSSAEPSTGVERGDLPIIVIGTDEWRVNDEAVAALTRAPDVYARAGALVTVTVEGMGNQPRIRPLGVAVLRERMTASADWRTLTPDGDAPAHPPLWSVQAVHGRGQWVGMRPLEGIVESPTMRPDLTVLDVPGYDAVTGLVYVPNAAFPKVPEAPTREEGMVALAQLAEVVVDFPFAAPEYRAGWLAFLLTAAARSAISGCAPLTACDATTRGTGKGMLCDAVANIVYGRDAAKLPQVEDEAEQRKRITALVLEGEPLAVIDNCSYPVGDAVLDALLTSTTWRDRILGRTETVAMRTRLVLACTGNNLSFAGDTLRRVVHIRLESPLECPEERDDFTHAHLLEWVRAERPRLVVAALTALRAYAVAGAPDQDLLPWGSFEAWSRLIRNCLVWLGQPDPAATRRELAASADTEKAALKLLLEDWNTMFGPAGGTVAQALRGLEKDRAEVIPQFSGLATAIAELAPAQPGKPTSGRSLGRKLQQLRGRVIGEMALDRKPVDAAAGAVWYVKATQPPAVGLKVPEGIPTLSHVRGEEVLSMATEDGEPSKAPKPTEGKRLKKRSEVRRTQRGGAL